MIYNEILEISIFSDYYQDVGRFGFAAAAHTDFWGAAGAAAAGGGIPHQYYSAAAAGSAAAAARAGLPYINPKQNLSPLMSKSQQRKIVSDVDISQLISG